jgi:hypothetical protein
MKTLSLNHLNVINLTNNIPTPMLSEQNWSEADVKCGYLFSQKNIRDTQRI